jgi:membrane fusion protein, multidrug efflux system
VPLVALPAAWYGYQWWTVGRFIESTDDAYVGGDITVIAPRVAGVIAEVAVADNQAVHAGDLLVRLDDRDYRAALDRATAALAGQRAALANLDARRHQQEAMVAEVSAEIAAADAEVGRSELVLGRYQRLASHEFASTQRLQAADVDRKQALAGADKARAALAAAEGQLAVIDTQKQATQAALAAATAGREIAELNLDYTEIRAPVDGTVGNRSARAGAFATGGTQLMSLVPARGLWIEANFKESQLAGIRPGQPASIEADVLPDERVLRSRREPRPCHRPPLQPAGRERDRQFRQDRAAGAGPHCARRGCRHARSPAARAFGDGERRSARFGRNHPMT